MQGGAYFTNDKFPCYIFFFVYTFFFSSPEPNAHGELIVYQSSRCMYVCMYVCVFTLSNKYTSENRGPIATKFYLKHHLGGGKAALGFGPDQMRTVVSVATDSSHRVIMGKML